MNFSEVRANYPQYDDLTDADLAKALHEKFYSDMSYEDFSKAVGLKVAPAPEPKLSPISKDWRDNLWAGAGAGIESSKRGIMQRLVDAGISLGAVPPTVRGRLQSEEKDARVTDKPLLETGAGRAGYFVSKAGPAALLSLLPGGAALGGSAAIGAASGLVEPVASPEESVGKNVLAGTTGSVLGWGIGKGVGMVGQKVAEKSAARAAQNAGRDTAVREALDAGYVLPPGQTNGSGVNKWLEGFSGKITTAQHASEKNQTLSNSIVKRGLGVADDQTLTKETYAAIRNEAGKAYEPFKKIGMVEADGAFVKALDDIASKYQGAARSFPGAVKKNEVVELIEGLKEAKSFDAADAIDMTKVLREAADAAYASGNKALGKANKQASDAIEDVLERRLEKLGDKEAVKAFRAARERIAKSYSAERATNTSTGNVRAQDLASQLKRGKPLSGDLLTVAKAGQSFPFATKEVNQSFLPISPLDAALATGLGVYGAYNENPYVGALAALRPAVRAGILSRPYQSRMLTPGYGGLLSRDLAPALASPGGRAALQGFGAGLMLPEPE